MGLNIETISNIIDNMLSNKTSEKKKSLAIDDISSIIDNIKSTIQRSMQPIKLKKGSDFTLDDIPKGADNVKNTVFNVIGELKNKYVQPTINYKVFSSDHDQNYQVNINNNHKYLDLDPHKYETGINISNIVTEDHSSNNIYKLSKEIIENTGFSSQDGYIYKVDLTNFDTKLEPAFIPMHTISYTIVPVVKLVNFDSSLSIFDSDSKYRIHNLVEYTPDLIRDCMALYTFVKHPEACLPIAALQGEFMNLVSVLKYNLKATDYDLETFQDIVHYLQDVKQTTMLFRTYAAVIRRNTIFNLDLQDVAKLLYGVSDLIEPIMMLNFYDHVNRINTIRNSYSDCGTGYDVIDFTYTGYRVQGTYTIVDKIRYSLRPDGTMQKTTKDSTIVPTSNVVRYAKLLKRTVTYPAVTIKVTVDENGRVTREISPNDKPTVLQHEKLLKLNFPTPSWDDLENTISTLKNYSRLKNKSITYELHSLDENVLEDLLEECPSFSLSFNGRSRTGSVTITGLTAKS